MRHLEVPLFQGFSGSIINSVLSNTDSLQISVAHSAWHVLFQTINVTIRIHLTNLNTVIFVGI